MRRRAAGLGLLLCCLSLSAGAAELPPWAGELGLARAEGGWSYSGRTLEPSQVDKLAEALSGLASADSPRLLETVLTASREAGLTAGQSPWIENDWRGTRKLTPAGKKAIPAILLGQDPREILAAAAAIGPGKPAALPPHLDLSKIHPTGFDGPYFLDGDQLTVPDDPADHPAVKKTAAPPRPYHAPGGDSDLTFNAAYGVSPNSITRGRDIETAYAAYGWSTDRLLHSTLGEHLQDGWGLATRAAKGLFLDVPVGLIGSFWEHELGHFEYAWMAGAHPYWSHSAGSNFAGILGETDIPFSDEIKMTPDQKLAFNDAGFASTQASTDDMRRRMVAGDHVDWYHLPLWAIEKMDTSIYPLLTPGPPGGNPDWDTTRWRTLYSQRSQETPSSLQAGMVAGALWNMADPMLAWSAYKYVHDYIGQGKERMDTPMVKVGDVQMTAGTNFWLTELGPQYRLEVIGKDPKSGTMVELAGTGSDKSQGTVEARVGNVPLGPAVRARVAGALWAQRAEAEPGPLLPGGAFTLGVDINFLKQFGLVTDIGYKSRGALIGRQVPAGPIFELGTQGTF